MRAENPQSKNAILIVEDLESDRQLMRIALSELKVKNEVVFCENGLERLGETPFHDYFRYQHAKDEWNRI
jgi:CheY-like chemotaxis protein